MDLMKMMRQAKDMQGKMQEMQSQFADIEGVGSSGGGLVEISVSAQGDLKRIKIDPALLKPEEVDILEDLIIAAHNDARAKAQEAAAEKMQSAMSNMGLPPGFKLPF